MWVSPICLNIGKEAGSLKRSIPAARSIPKNRNSIFPGILLSLSKPRSSALFRVCPGRFVHNQAHNSHREQRPQPSREQHEKLIFQEKRTGQQRIQLPNMSRQNPHGAPTVYSWSSRRCYLHLITRQRRPQVHVAYLQAGQEAPSKEKIVLQPAGATNQDHCVQ